MRFFYKGFAAPRGLPPAPLVGAAASRLGLRSRFPESGSGTGGIRPSALRVFDLRRCASPWFASVSSWRESLNECHEDGGLPPEHAAGEAGSRDERRPGPHVARWVGPEQDPC